MKEEELEKSVSEVSERCAECKSINVQDEEHDRNWILCEICNLWFHYDCVKLTEKQARDIAQFHCPKCRAKNRSPSVPRRKSRRTKALIDYAALDRGELSPLQKHPYCQYVTDRKWKVLPNLEAEGEVTANLIKNRLDSVSGGVNQPLVIRARDYDSLDMQMPRDLTVSRVCELLGPSHPVSVMEVSTQNLASGGWDMKQWTEYYNSSDKDRILNVISLEVSGTPLAELVRRPKFVRDLDLVDKVWIDESAPDDSQVEKPKVSLYCLMSVQDSYTDFHIDFGGSSVFYHVLRGQKTFLFIPPTPTNLTKYEKWCKAPDQSQSFLADLVRDCYRVDLEVGDTMLIPSGWIHAVHSPQDSLVIGGNFLTDINVPMQLDLVRIENATKVPAKFKFPKFNRVMWLTALYYYENRESVLQNDREKMSHLKLIYNYLKNAPNKGIPKQVRQPSKFLDKFGAWVEERPVKREDTPQAGSSQPVANRHQPLEAVPLQPILVGPLQPALPQALPQAPQPIEPAPYAMQFMPVHFPAAPNPPSDLFLGMNSKQWQVNGWYPYSPPPAAPVRAVKREAEENSREEGSKRITVGHTALQTLYMAIEERSVVDGGSKEAM